ncbi:MAG: hypothetical protein ACR2NL_06340 [Acidimicrobiia bacterium]
MTIAIPDTKHHSNGYFAQTILVVVGLALAAGLLYLAVGPTASDSGTGVAANQSSVTESFFSEEWVAAQAAVGETPVRPFFSEEWVAAQAAVGETPVRPFFSEEWLAAQVRN